MKGVYPKILDYPELVTDVQKEVEVEEEDEVLFFVLPELTIKKKMQLRCTDILFTKQNLRRSQRLNMLKAMMNSWKK